MRLLRSMIAMRPSTGGCMGAETPGSRAAHPASEDWARSDQEQLALRSGVTRNVLIDVEHGRRGLLHERL
jgi:hypothetical protein